VTVIMVGGCPTLSQTVLEQVREEGAKTLRAYIRAARVGTDDKAEGYVIADAIAALLHYAVQQGFTPENLTRSALANVEVETTMCVHCGSVGDPDLHDCDVCVTEEPMVELLHGGSR